MKANFIYILSMTQKMPAAGEKFGRFKQIEWPRSDLVIKANIKDSFEIDVS